MPGTSAQQNVCVRARVCVVWRLCSFPSIEPWIVYIQQSIDKMLKYGGKIDFQVIRNVANNIKFARILIWKSFRIHIFIYVSAATNHKCRIVDSVLCRGAIAKWFIQYSPKFRLSEQLFMLSFKFAFDIYNLKISKSTSKYAPFFICYLG